MISRSRSSISGAADKHTIDFVTQTKIVIFGSVRIDVMDDEKGLIIYNTPDGRSKVALMARDGMVWLNQQSIAELFGTSVPNISMHISNIFKDNELEKNSVVKDYLTTAADGKPYHVMFYSLPMIIAIGYKVKGVRGADGRPDYFDELLLRCIGVIKKPEISAVQKEHLKQHVQEAMERAAL